MILPELHGQLSQPGFFIYTACDSSYFEEFGRSFINSVLRNTTVGLHIHIFNPTQDQLNFCSTNSRISVSHEYISTSSFIDAGNRWNTESTDDLEKLRRLRILTAMTKGNDTSIVDRIQKTYYACARFIRLQTLTSIGDKFLAVDVDAIVRGSVPTLPTTCDCYMYKITGKKARVLAGGLYSNGSENSNKFIIDYAKTLTDYFQRDYIYWSLDQDVLDEIVPKYNIGNLPYSLIDWEMKPDSIIWTAKGTRKDLEIFISEKKKYIA